MADATLRDALDRLATATQLHFAYSAELLPLDRRVCLAADSMTVGEALGALLRGTAIEIVVATPTQIVLAPMRVTHVAGGESEPTVARNVGSLDRVVITGNAVASEQRSLTVALDVIDGGALEQRGTTTMSQAVNASVPGIWMWEQSPTSLLATYASLRGASSFGVSYPKLYIDGIEVANPLLVAQFTPETIDRVEVIRGPQGAALYGSDAISGVINVVTSHAAADQNGQHTSMQSGFGMSQTAFSPHPALVQNHAFAVRGGTGLKSADLAVRVGTLGDYMPGAYAHQLTTTGGVRLIGSRASVSATGRLFAEDAGVARSPMVGNLPPHFDRGPPDGLHVSRERIVPDSIHHSPVDSIAGQLADSTAPQSVREYTLGATGTFMQNDRWTHSLVVGVDGYRLDNVVAESGPVLSATDSALLAARGGADRATLRASSVVQLGSTDAPTTLTVAAEHAALREQTVWTVADAGHPGPPQHLTQAPVVRWQSNTGLLGQFNSSYHNSLFVTGGLRLEHNDALSDNQNATLPMLGVAAVRDVGDLTVKFRSAYGKGIRSPMTPMRALMSVGANRGTPVSALSPEQQAGLESGIDLFVARRLAFHLTRFDQRASGLIQQVTMLETTGAAYHFFSELQNVGEISNAGWEVESSLNLGKLSFGGTVSSVTSRVERLALGYAGDLRPGDRMLGVPARTASLVSSFAAIGWSASLTTSHAWDWVNYDRLALSRAVADPTRPSHDFVGPQLRSFWTTYNGYTHVRASASRDLLGGLALVVTGDNLLNRQTGEPDNITVVPGRTLTAGVRAKF
jgi:iron complex outermembrane receptor protein